MGRGTILRLGKESRRFFFVSCPAEVAIPVAIPVATSHRMGKSRGMHERVMHQCEQRSIVLHVRREHCEWTTVDT